MTPLRKKLFADRHTCDTFILLIFLYFKLLICFNMKAENTGNLSILLHVTECLR